MKPPEAYFASLREALIERGLFDPTQTVQEQDGGAAVVEPVIDSLSDVDNLKDFLYVVNPVITVAGMLVYGTYQFKDAVQQMRLGDYLDVLWGYTYLCTQGDDRPLLTIEAYSVEMVLGIVYDAVLETLMTQMTFVTLPGSRYVNKVFARSHKGDISTLAERLGKRLEEVEGATRSLADAQLRQSLNTQGPAQIRYLMESTLFRMHQWIYATPRVLSELPDTLTQMWLQNTSRRVDTARRLGAFVADTARADTHRQRILVKATQAYNRVPARLADEFDVEYLCWYHGFLQQVANLSPEEHILAARIAQEIFPIIDVVRQSVSK